MMSKRVLVVDDQKELREIISRRVEEAGFTMLATATNGPEALLRAADDVPDIVILDYMMPGMTGEEVAREMHGQFPDIKIIACSGSTVSKPYWADAYLDKSQLADLASVLRSV
jgi:CheY-like chemotaxis protein